ncbi:hypothetical protein PVAG01_02911 [Phlyctema vagabunda]|uniref:Chitin synthase activator n=1 Tax=Phlyctema vagabunda TaxID=108571 RepID=A0ABR4PS15_9HELO
MAYQAGPRYSDLGQQHQEYYHPPLPHYHQQQLQQQQQQQHFTTNQQYPQYDQRQYVSQHPPHQSQSQHQHQLHGQTPRYNMSGHEYSQPTLGATFYPGGHDDFLMPELVSPSPQRIMPEVPSNMQENLANLELEARNPQSRINGGGSAPSQYLQARGGTPADPRANEPHFTASYDHTNASAYQNLTRDSQQYIHPHHLPESPNFSPFPKLRNPGPNVPLSDDDKEEVLERARPLVLKSSDPEMQLAWAQDALAWVEVASQNNARLVEGGQAARSVTPKIEHGLRTDAMNIVLFLAEQQHPKAEFIKAMWLEFGKFGYRVDKKEAFAGYSRAAEKGYARAEYRIGMHHEGMNDAQMAIKHYKIGVTLKDSASNYRLGMMVLLGQHNQPQNYRRGVEYIRFAADSADENAPQGAYIYGMLLARELPNIEIPEAYLPYDSDKAKLYIEKAAYLGFSKAQFKMAQAYELCQLGCEFEPALSLHYNALAARQGEPEADMAISKWFLCGHEGVFEKNEELAFNYATRAAQTELPTAEFALGYFHEIGMFVTTDLRKALSWYRKAADHGNKDALVRIDGINQNHTLSRTDHEQVAISRIRSQHGSMRGQRPERLRQRGASLPPTAEERIDIPPQHRESRVQPQNVAPPTIRPTSVAPYPEDDMAFSRGSSQPPLSPYYNPAVRASSAAGPPIADRPSSAFGIRPPAHSSTVPYPANTLHPMGQPVRPATSQGNMPPPVGRGGPPMSQPPGSNRNTFPNRPAPIDQGPAPGPGRMQRPPAGNTNKPQPPMPSQGSGADGSGRRPVPDIRYSSQPPSQINTPGYDGRASAASSRPPSSVSSQQVQSPPSRLDSAQSGRQEPSRTSQRPVQPVQPATAGSSGNSAATGSSAPSPAPKPSKGPATFEEMGIPQSKSDNDCIVM